MDEKQKLCLSCMECCKNVVFTIALKDWRAHLAQLYRARGYKYFAVGTDVKVLVPSVCRQLDLNFGCKMYDIRPTACRVFDGSKHPIMKDYCKW